MFGEGIIWCGLFQLALIKIPITLSLIGVTSSSEIQFLAFKLIKILLNFLLRLSCFFSISLVSFNFRARGLVATFISISQTHFDSASVLFSTTLHLLTKRQKPKLFFFRHFALAWSFLLRLIFIFFFFVNSHHPFDCFFSALLDVRKVEHESIGFVVFEQRFRRVEKRKKECTSSRLLSFITRLVWIMLCVRFQTQFRHEVLAKFRGAICERLLCWWQMFTRIESKSARSV